LKKIKVFFEEFNREGDNFDHIDKVVPHQGSKAGLDFFMNEYAIESKIVRNFETRGNCVAASIPLALFEAIESGAIKKGNRVLLTGTAAGISVGALLIQI
jgi:3-oxoacyl-[acyl-carrier-protein] synthase-3